MLTEFATVLRESLRLGDVGWVTFTVEGGIAKTVLVAVVVQLCLYFADLYDSRSYSDPAELFIRLVKGLGAAAFCLAVLYFWLTCSISQTHKAQPVRL